MVDALWRSGCCDRRAVVLGGLASFAASAGGALAQGVGAPAAGAPASPAFGFEQIVEFARERAASDYHKRKQVFSKRFDNLDYDEYRGIRYLPERRLWREEARGFSIDLTPPGFFYTEPVAINLVSDGEARALSFDSAAFRYPEGWPELGPEDAEADPDMGFSGFRVLFALNRPDKEDEVVVFQGASYFRAVARGQNYGLSARGLALGTGSPEGEEFPAFTDFWLHQPQENATSLLIHALLDSPSVAGAYEFVLRPGAETVMETRVALFPRRDLKDVGIAPLTSMYYFGPKDRLGVDDFREAVHDSSGLQIVNGAGERIWRPLNNPARLQSSFFVDEAPQGYGLAQRKRRFEQFQDSEARYDKRPSCWVEPSGDWGAGGVKLVEIPTPNEFNDNIVAFWSPEAKIDSGGRFDFDYRLIWSERAPDAVQLARVVETREGLSVNDKNVRHLIIDFEFPEEAPKGIEIQASTTSGSISHVALYALPRENSVRAAIDFVPPSEGATDMRVVLVDAAQEPASETWLSLWDAP